MKGGARQHHAIDQGHGHTDLDAAGERAQHTTRGRPVNVEAIADARVDRRDDVGLLLDDEADVAHQPRVEDAMDVGAGMRAARRQAAQGGAGSGGELVGG